MRNWTESDLEQLRRMCAAGQPVAAIAAALNKTTDAIRMKLFRADRANALAREFVRAGMRESST